MSTVDDLLALTGDSDPILRCALVLAAALGTPPLDESDFSLRDELLTDSIRDLTSLGIDAENLVRYGMHLRMTGALVTLFLLETAAVSEAKYAVDRVDLQRWRELLRLPAPTEMAPDGITSPEELVRVSREHFAQVQVPLRMWVENGPIGEVLSLVAPSREVFEAAMGSTEAGAEVRESYRWAADRLVETDLRRWPTTSLHLEFKWVNGTLPMLFVEALFLARQVDELGIQAEISRRAVGGASGGDGTELIFQLQAQAKVFLKQGRHAEASALFSFYASLNEDDPAGHNNYGFCLLPVDPNAALESFDRAKKRGYSGPGILAYNRACCMMLLSREGEALDVLEYYWNRERTKHAEQAILWRKSNAAWEIYDEFDIRYAIADLGAQLADKVAPGRAAMWRTRSKRPHSDAPAA